MAIARLRLPRRRTVLKAVHWASFFLILYFFLVEPEENRADPSGALSTHAGVGLLLALVTLVWFAQFLRQGLASRPGPKLPGVARKVYVPMHKTLQYGVVAMVASGALAGLLAPFAIKAFGAIQINLGIGSKTLHELAQEVHEIIFDALIIVIVLHALFHVWRHYRLKDNALKIMVPKALHKYL